MSARRILRLSTAVFASLVIIATISAVLIVRSSWFFENVRTRLVTTLPLVDVMNRRVTALLQRALRLFDTTLDLIREAAGLDHQYTAGGALTRGTRPVIDGRA